MADQAHLELLLRQVEARAKYQREEWDGLDRKSTTILATAGVLFGLVVNRADQLEAVRAPGSTLFLLALGALVVALGAAAFALWPREFKVVPEPEPFVRRHAETSTEWTLGGLIGTQVYYFGKNREPMKRKLRALRAQLVLVWVAATLLAAVIAISEAPS